MKRLVTSLAIATLGLTAIALPGIASARDLYGAIAYSQQTKNYSWATDFNSQEAAENAAMDECYNKASDCRIATWFQNACGALAVGEDGGWGAHWGKNFRQAQNKALSACNGSSYNCEVVVTKCVQGY
jgi:serine/threonine-protein kinase